jgi:uncharacterized protein (DUF433 family)
MSVRCSVSGTYFRATSKPQDFRYTTHPHGTALRNRDVNPQEVPNYTLEEAGRWLHVPIRTMHYWVIGNRYAAPLTTIFSRRPILLSIKNLVECFVLEGLRNTHSVSLQAVRISVEDLRRRNPSKYPLADYQLSTLGDTVYLENEGDPLIKLASHGQQAFKEILDPFLKRVERNTDGIAKMLFPFTRKRHMREPVEAPRVVVIDPNVSFGMPVLINSRISTAFLLSRKKGGASISELAADYGRSNAEIEEAIQFEEAV